VHDRINDAAGAGFALVATATLGSTLRGEVPMPVIRPALLAVVSAAAFAVDEPPAIAIGGGVSYLSYESSRAIVDEGGNDDLADTYGWSVYLGLSAPQRAVIGFPWIDIIGTRHDGNDARIESLGVLYIERAPVTESLYLGGGVGSFYDSVHLPATPGSNRVSDHDWRVGFKALIGYGFGPGPFLELSYQYSGETHGIETTSANLLVGMRF
jgi:hypothetical protein